MRLGRARRSRDASADTKAHRRRSSKTRENAGPWPHAGSVATKGFLALVLCGVACGPVALIRSALPAPAPAAAPAVDTTHHDRRAAQIASATAVEVTTLMLTSTPDELDALQNLVAVHLKDARLPRKPGPAPTTVVAADVAASSSDSSLWQVTVITMGGQSGTGQAWTVPVHVDQSGHAIAIRLPGQIPMPAPAQAPDVAAPALAL